MDISIFSPNVQQAFKVFAQTYSSSNFDHALANGCDWIETDKERNEFSLVLVGFKNGDLTGSANRMNEDCSFDTIPVMVRNQDRICLQ